MMLDWDSIQQKIEDDFFRALDAFDRNRVRFGWTY